MQQSFQARIRRAATVAVVLFSAAAQAQVDGPSADALALRKLVAETEAAEANSLASKANAKVAEIDATQHAANVKADQTKKEIDNIKAAMVSPDPSALRTVLPSNSATTPLASVHAALANELRAGKACQVATDWREACKRALSGTVQDACRVFVDIDDFVTRSKWAEHRVTILLDSHVKEVSALTQELEKALIDATKRADAPASKSPGKSKDALLSAQGSPSLALATTGINILMSIRAALKPSVQTASAALPKGGDLVSASLLSALFVHDKAGLLGCGKATPPLVLVRSENLPPPVESAILGKFAAGQSWFQRGLAAVHATGALVAEAPKKLLKEDANTLKVAAASLQSALGALRAALDTLARTPEGSALLEQALKGESLADVPSNELPLLLHVGSMTSDVDVEARDCLFCTFRVSYSSTTTLQWDLMLLDGRITAAGLLTIATPWQKTH